jgi:hypothetical protein
MSFLSGQKDVTKKECIEVRGQLGSTNPPHLVAHNFVQLSFKEADTFK